jgi:hypothetical protein
MKHPQPGQLQVWWIPQVPGKPFTVNVETLMEAKLVLKTLEQYDIFQFKQRIKPAYSNAGGLRVWSEHDKDWEDWYDEDGLDIDHTKTTHHEPE